MIDLKTRISEISNTLKSLTVTESLRWLSEQFPQQVCYSSAFGLEGQVITHFIFKNKLPISVFTIDTGRNFQETYKVWNATNQKYGQTIKAYYPLNKEVEKLLTTKGPTSFYNSVQERIECCNIRKVEPLNRALQGQKIWLSGIRAQQSLNRSGMQPVEWDEQRQMIKVYPLFYWTSEEVKALIRNENIPYNELFDKGFTSIGCAPCTRAIQPGQNERAGRWWWEENTDKECGIHLPQPSNFTI